MEGIIALSLLLAFAVISGGMIFATLAKKEKSEAHDKKEPPKHEKPASNDESHGGGHGGHGHNPYGWAINLAILVAIGLLAYLGVLAVQGMEGPVQHSIQVAGTSEMDEDSSHYCTSPAADATVYEAKPAEWTVVDMKQGGYEFCTNPGPSSGTIQFECEASDSSGWSTCDRYSVRVRFKSKLPVTIWQEAHRPK